MMRATMSAAMRVALLASGLMALSGCSTAQLQQAVADGQLFCAEATASGPLVVAVADASAGGSAYSVIGKSAALVAAVCAAIGAVPVSPPANAASAPVVAVQPPAG